MKNLVRGVVILSLISMFVVFIYAQTSTESTLNIATDSQTELNKAEINKENLVTKTLKADNKVEKVAKATAQAVVMPVANETTKTTDDKKLVEKTVMSRAAGASKGKFSATAYCLKGRTASGSGVRKGIIAVDPRVLKLGSTVNISAGPYSGNYLVADTGGAIKGKKIDIWVASCSEARRFGRRTVSINALGK